MSEMIDGTNAAGYIAGCEAIRDGDLRPLVWKTSVPSLIIASALDESTPAALADELHDAIAESELVVFEDAPTYQMK